MTTHKTRTTKFNKESLASLPNDKPITYKILNSKGKNVYTGSAKRGRVSSRLGEHLPGGPDRIPGGAKVQIQQKSSISQAQKTEADIIARSKPRYNKQGK